MTSRFRVALVGLNHYHATGWAETLTQMQDLLDIVAVYDPDPTRRETLRPDFHDPTLPAQIVSMVQELPFYTDLAAMVQEQRPDAALVLLHNRDAPAAIQLLARAGVHSFVDKPGGRTAAELAAAMEAAKAAGVTVGTGLLWRYNQDAVQARDWVMSGRLGEIIGAEATLITSTVTQRNPANFLFDEELAGGGVLHWLGVHRIDSLRWITGQEIVAVQAMMAPAKRAGVSVEETAAVCFELENGAIGMLYAGYHLPRWITTGYLAVHGTERSVNLAMSGMTVTDQSQVTPPAPPPPPGPHVPGYGGATGIRAIRDWLMAATGQAAPVSTGDDLVRALMVIDAAYESARTGMRVRIG